MRKFEQHDVFYQTLSDFEKNKKEVLFLQIGSNDGISNDPLREFIVRGNRWQGCLVEPLPQTFRQLTKNYAYARRVTLKFRNAAISNKAGQVPIYRVKNEFHAEMPGFPDQVASFDPEHVIKHFPEHLRARHKVESVPVEVLTPSILLRELALERIDVLHLDVEGHEKKILDAFPISEISPKIIIFEHAHLSPLDRQDLTDKLDGWHFKMHNTQFDTIAVRGL